MPAVIESTLYESPGGAVVAGSTQQNSRDDLQMGYQVTLRSFHAATTYSWSLSFASDSPGSTVPGTPFDGTQSAAALLAPEGSTSRDAKFNVDFEGTYLIRLVVDAGLPTEDASFIRARVLTMFGALKLVAAGERRDEKGVIPVDATPEGWANDQNANLQRIAVLLRRVSHSGRILFVDSNRGRGIGNDQDDYDNLISIPGPEAARREETGIKLRAMAHGDFTSINDAITYAAAAAARGEPVPSQDDPYIIVVRKGLYIEDLNLTSYVHIVGDEPTVFGVEDGEGTKANVTIRSANTGGVGTHTFNPQQNYDNAECFLVNVFLHATGNTTLPVLDQLGGLVGLFGCEVSQEGDAVNQGEAIRVVVSNAAHAPALHIENSRISSEATTGDRVALRFDGIDGFCSIKGTYIQADSCFGVSFNDSLYQTAEFRFTDGSFIDANEAYYGYGSLQEFRDSRVFSVVATAINIEPFGGGPKAGDVTVRVNNTTLEGDLSFATAGAVGDTNLYTSGIISDEAGGPHIQFPDAPGDLPTLWRPELDAETLRYVQDHANPLAGPGAPATINALNRLPKTNVQEAIDTLVLALFPVLGSPFYSLNTAYAGLSTLNPPTLGSGLGRTIAATGGAVQITGGTAPLAIDSHLKHGGLQAEGVVDIGGLINGGVGDTLVDVGHSEIHLNPNMMGAGPFVALGRSGWTNGITGGNRGFGAAVVLADQVAADDSSFNLHMRTADGRASGTGKLGNLYLAAGSINDSGSAATPGDVHIIAGYSEVVAGLSGSLYLAPGFEPGGSGGQIFLIGWGGHTNATLVAAGAYVGGQAGTVYIGTPSGVEQFTFTGAENIAAATALFNATAKGFRATDDGVTITLESHTNPAADIVYVGDSVAGALNTALGDFRAHLAAFTPGAYGDAVALDVPAHGTLRVNGNLVVTGTLTGGTGYQAVTAAMHPYSAVAGDRILGVQLGAGADIDVVLDSTLVLAGTKVTIKDENGIANAIAAPLGQKIHITDTNGATFDGAAFLDITTNDGATTLYVNGAGNWSLI